MQEFPLESIVGKATGGSINIDGNSAIRRTCNLSMVVDEKDTIITDAYWAYKNKFKVEIGLKNTINPDYPDIIWFKQGIFAIVNFSKSYGMTNINISISGKDKMCFLNGDLGGKFASEIDLGAIDKEEPTGIWTTQKLTLYKIIQNVVHTYGEEDFRNIIINDLDIVGYELMSYKGNEPMYLIMKKDKEAPFNLVKKGFKVYKNDTAMDISQLGNNGYSTFNIFLSKGNIAETYGITPSGAENYYIIKLDYNTFAGYHEVPLTYTQDLIAKAGETVQSVLEKLKNMLGNYEYFYDLDGRFVFQKNKTYIQASTTPTESQLYEPTMAKSNFSYVFEDYQLITAINENPQITNLKNDFSIWGERENASGIKSYPHLRYAVDKKPSQYTNFDGITYTTNASDSIHSVDWREVIYQMASDHLKYEKTDPSFYHRIYELNPDCIDGKTGYEQYYQDIIGFWRELYDPDPKEEEKNLYYPEGHAYQYWRKTVVESPQTINFWFDFLDTDGELKNVSAYKIGNRLITEDQSTIKSVCTENIPEVKYIFGGEDKPEGASTMEALVPIQIPSNLKGLFDIAAPGASAFEKLNELIYKHLTLPLGFSVTTIPIYYLEPNTRIKLSDKGDCLLSQISYNLASNATMSLTCSAITKQFIKEVG